MGKSAFLNEKDSDCDVWYILSWKIQKRAKTKTAAFWYPDCSKNGQEYRKNDSKKYFHSAPPIFLGDLLLKLPKLYYHSQRKYKYVYILKITYYSIALSDIFIIYVVL